MSLIVVQSESWIFVVCVAKESGDFIAHCRVRREISAIDVAYVKISVIVVASLAEECRDFVDCYNKIVRYKKKQHTLTDYNQ